jgi:hypothetical protein
MGYTVREYRIWKRCLIQRRECELPRWVRKHPLYIRWVRFTREQLLRSITNIDPIETPLVNLIRKEPYSSFVHDWILDDLLSVKDIRCRIT